MHHSDSAGVRSCAKCVHFPPARRSIIDLEEQSKRPLEEVFPFLRIPKYYQFGPIMARWKAKYQKDDHALDANSYHHSDPSRCASECMLWRSQNHIFHEWYSAMQPRLAWMKVTKHGPLHNGHVRQCAIPACPAWKAAQQRKAKQKPHHSAAYLERSQRLDYRLSAPIVAFLLHPNCLRLYWSYELLTCT